MQRGLEKACSDVREICEFVVLGPWDKLVKANLQKTLFDLLRPVGAVEVVLT